MKKLIIKWILISIAFGMIPVAILGVSQGGIALSPVIFFLFLSVGLTGAAIHANIYSYKRGIKKQRLQAFVFSCISVLAVGFLIYSESRCELQQEYATERANGYLRSKSDLDIINLGSGVFDHENCVCTFEYSGPTNKFTIIVTEYGDLHFSQ